MIPFSSGVPLPPEYTQSRAFLGAKIKRDTDARCAEGIGPGRGREKDHRGDGTHRQRWHPKFILAHTLPLIGVGMVT